MKTKEPHERLKQVLVTLLSLLLIMGVGLSLRQAMSSSLFTLQKVEIKPPFYAPSGVQITEDDLRLMIDAPVGQGSIFNLDLKSIEERLLTHSWIKKVHLQKKLPRTLVVGVEFRIPEAYFQTNKGDMVYVDADGELFGAASENNLTALPLLSGFSAWDTHVNTKKRLEDPNRQLFHPLPDKLPSKLPSKLKEALLIISYWEKSSLNELAPISTIHWDKEKGFRLLASYFINSHIRIFIDIGHEIDTGLEEKLGRLSSVIRYLSNNAIVARQIWADVGKKIVVKIVQGS